MKVTKKYVQEKINEIVDSYMNLIGDDGYKSFPSDSEVTAGKTTDEFVDATEHEPFYPFLYGYVMYESIMNNEDFEAELDDDAREIVKQLERYSKSQILAIVYELIDSLDVFDKHNIKKKLMKKIMNSGKISVM